jgi:hypothetical protein
MAFQCPTCGAVVETRVLADPVTLIALGYCDQHGMSELSRVYLGEQTAVARAEESRGTAAYKPGACCGRRLGEHDWCHLPVDHDEPHAA